MTNEKITIFTSCIFHRTILGIIVLCLSFISFSPSSVSLAASNKKAVEEQENKEEEGDNQDNLTQEDTDSPDSSEESSENIPELSFPDAFYTEKASDIHYDTEQYDNLLYAIVIQNSSNGGNILSGVTLKSMPADAVSYRYNAEEYLFILQFNKTKNALGNYTKEINNGIIRSVHVWEENNNTQIAVSYEPKYLYSVQFSQNRASVTFTKGNFSLRIPLPENVNYQTVTTTDQYWLKKFIIYIPGNYVDYYKTYAPYINTSTQIKKVTVSKASDGRTKITVSTPSLKGYRLTQGEGFFTVKVGSPKSIYKNIVLLDAGHGGKDNGAVKAGTKEKNLNLSILYTRAKEYFDSKNSPVKAYWTRHDDTFVNLYTRPKLTKTYSADLFISLHMNSSVSAAKGLEVYYSKSNNKKNASGLTSKTFAKRMCNTLSKGLSAKNRGVKQAAFVVVKKNTVPAILIELGFLSNKSDRKKLKSASYQKKAAKLIYEEVKNTFKKYPTKR